ncbi:BTAD domain-containing putative transcriptional regulator [Lentzea sp. NPDC005914]|uniref:AfsR/SARP family transcriptional regulator n=1 Tax=Lentzea sp. NPDC005914 TaxID=3154572 RepID=UPI0033D36753
MWVKIALLGEVTARVGERLVDLGTPRQRCVLAALAVDAGRLVPADRLMSRVWGVDAPRRGRAALHTHISRLRGAFSGALAIVRRSDGYTLEIDRPDQAVDLLRFRALRGRVRGVADDPHKVALLTEALALWQGPPLCGLSGEWVNSERDRWQEEYEAAERDLTDARLALGLGEELVPPLSARAVRNPLDERVAGQYMVALHRAGRSADALDHYRQLRGRLVEELGTDPGEALQNLHQQILVGDPRLISAHAGVATQAVVISRQLPAAPASFVGRREELDRLDATLSLNSAADTAPAEVGPPGRTVLITAIGGAGGIGKTWLALTWAHRHLDRFPDGQLFTDLRGFSPTEQVVTPDAALFGFLTALGVAPHRIPADPDAQAALYRSLVAGKRMLVVLDNAATADQVAPLLPGSPTCTVLVTGRVKLASLIDRHGARHLQLDVLDRAEARALLVARLGMDRVAAEPDAVDELVALCGGYPLALSITARNAASHPAISLTEIAAELRELGVEMLDHGTDSSASLPAVLSWSLRRLTDEQRAVFGLLGVAPGPDVALPAVAALTGLSLADSRRALLALEEASLIGRRAHGRYAMHDLVRAYAATTARDLPDNMRETALNRVLDFYLNTAHNADRLMEPTRQLLPPDSPAPGVHPHSLPDAAAATAWLEVEHINLLAAQRVAVSVRRHNVVWHLAWALSTFYFRRAHRRDMLDMWRVAVDAAAYLPDPTALSRALRSLGFACARLDLYEEASRHLNRALDLAVRHHDSAEQADTHLALAFVWEQQGDDPRALDHARHALDLRRALGQPVLEAVALSQVGWYAARTNDFDTARDYCHAALTLHRRHDNLDGEAATLDSLGLIAHRVGDYQQAVGYYYQAVALYRTQGNAYHVADTLDNVGHPHAALGQSDRAREAWREALELYREQGRDNDAARMRRQLDDLG